MGQYSAGAARARPVHPLRGVQDPGDQSEREDSRGAVRAQAAEGGAGKQLSAATGSTARQSYVSFTVLITATNA